MRKLRETTADDLLSIDYAEFKKFLQNEEHSLKGDLSSIDVPSLIEIPLTELVLSMLEGGFINVAASLALANNIETIMAQAAEVVAEKINETNEA